MKKRLSLYLTFLFSARSADALYDAAKPVLLLRGSRNTFTVAITLGITIVLAYFFFAQGTRNESPSVFVKDKLEYYVPSPDQFHVEYTTPKALKCTFQDECHRELRQSPSFLRNQLGTSVPNLSTVYENDQQPLHMLVQYTIEVARVVADPNDQSSVILLPRLAFERADLYINDFRERTFFNSERMSLHTEALKREGMTLDIMVVMTISKAQAKEFIQWPEPVFITTPKAFAVYEQFKQAADLNPSRQIATVARVTMAVFALILFLIVESSPESLGLAMFMGFDALGMILAHNDLRSTWLPANLQTAWFEHTCHAMGDVFRLYFFLQLARISSLSFRWWFGLGFAYSLTYGILRSMNRELNWYIIEVMPAARDFFVASLGIVILTRSAVHLWGRGVPWRVVALVVAAIGASAQWLWSAPAYMPWLPGLIDPFFNFYAAVNVINTNCSFLLALSTFINISTLENRVRTLSSEKARAEAIERELELGREVQQTFLQMPPLPNKVKISTFHEAAVYVSGDTYHVAWDPERQTVALLLNDVTGHGVQAALKAYACKVIARSVWTDTVNFIGTASPQRLLAYEDAVESFVCKHGSNTSDFNAMIGAELDINTGHISLYRTNHGFPVLVTPTPGGFQATALAIPNRVLWQMNLKPESYLVFLSDGFISNPRMLKQYLDFLNKNLLTKTDLNPISLRELMLSWEGFMRNSIVDDKTLLICAWDPEEKIVEKDQPKAA